MRHLPSLIPADSLPGPEEVFFMVLWHPEAYNLLHCADIHRSARLRREESVC
jgi:hypothetical protein